MKTKRDHRYFIVKHDLRSFLALPGTIWRSRASRRKAPAKFNQVKEGDRWIEFAHIMDGDEKPCSLIVGFYECTREARCGVIPRKRRTSEGDWDWNCRAWMIEGKPYGRQPSHGPVSVPSIDTMLGRRLFHQTAIIPGITARDFERIRDITFQRQLAPKRIPLLRREPRNEQEVLSLVVAGHEALGIEKILGVQTRFPDMLVKVNGKEMHLELEFDSLSFLEHWNALRPIPNSRKRREARLRDKTDKRPVAVLCWVDSDKEGALRKRVRHLRVYELQFLLRKRQKIRWQ